MADTTVDVVSPAELAARCHDDGEFRLAARFWTGGLRLEIDGVSTGFRVRNGEVEARVPTSGDGVVTLAAPADVWEKIIEPVPPPYFNDVAAALGVGLGRSGDELAWWQYQPAIQRAVELLRPPTDATVAPVDESGATPRFDSPVGRYAHIDLDGIDHRIYFEEAGTGIPLLLQHTAGAHGSQWRHLFEAPEITDHFRLIAYDLPFHGKSVPPVGRRWWEERYRLEGALLRSIPLRLSTALDLDRPAFMGCSVGGLLALDLALHHPDAFRAVVSLEGALHIGGDWERLTGFWDPRVSNETKARMMEGLTGPTSPQPYRKETIQVYAAGWPPAFLGDLWYYMVDYDIRGRAAEIDTERVAVHILNGEYDHSGTVAHGREAHEAIDGSTFTEMTGVGHFPMSENPERFIEYLLPVLEAIRVRG